VYPRLFTTPPFELFGRHIEPITLHTYGVILALAFLAGLWVASWQARKSGLDPVRITDMAVYVLIAGLLGAKLLLVVVEWDAFRRNPWEILSIFRSGGVFYGGLLGAFPVAWWYARRHALPGWATADVLAPGVALGQAIGRLGCFCAGCCYGKSADVPWAVTFRDIYATRQVGTPIDTPLHPTQLYESAATLLIFLVLVWMARRKSFSGQITLAYVALYAIVRFGIEFYRGDAVRGTVFGTWMSTSQFIAVLMVLGAAALVPIVRRKGQGPPAPQGAPA
jgi:phosphatidylglycerol---prolipoprotein diacylglyceryl transferase